MSPLKTPRRPCHPAPRRNASLLLACFLLAGGAPASGGEDVAYLGTAGEGLWRLESGRLKRVAREPALVLGVARGAGTTLWLMTPGNTVRFDGGKPETVGTLLSPGMALFLTTTPSGEPVIANQQHVAVLRGEGWRVAKLPRLAREMLKDMELDRRGRLWLHMGDRLTSRGEEGAWRDEPPPDEAGGVRGCRFAISPGRDLYLGCGTGIFRQGERGWERLVEMQGASLTDFAVGPGEGFAAGAVYGDVLLFDWQRGEPTTIRFESPCGEVRALAVDGKRRAWVGGPECLAVFAADGTRLSLPRPLARLTDVRAVLIEGQGPELAPVAGKKAKGGKVPP